MTEGSTQQDDEEASMVLLRNSKSDTASAPAKLVARPLSRALGAEISGLDLAVPLSADVVSALSQALGTHGILLFANQRLTPEQQIAFSRNFGDLEQHVLSEYNLPGHPEIFMVSNIVENGKPKGRAGAGQYWHSDMSYLKRPSLGSILYALEVPEVGGDTCFASMYKAYDALSEPMKKMLSGLRAVHDFAHSQQVYLAPRNYKPASADQVASRPPVDHPVIRVHPETGRKALYVNPGMTSHILGLTADESRAILDCLFETSVRPEFVYRHRWRVGDVIFWDNRCVMHNAINDYGESDRRLMQRTTVGGDEPF
jgi:taurine dioxygenase